MEEKGAKAPCSLLRFQLMDYDHPYIIGVPIHYVNLCRSFRAV